MRDFLSHPVLAFARLDDGGVIIILGAFLILFGHKRIPELMCGMRRGLFEFLKATRSIRDFLDQQGFDAGRSIGGIHGKSACEILSVDNKTAELYDPEALQARKRINFKVLSAFLRNLKRRLLPIILIAAIVFLLVTIVTLL